MALEFVKSQKGKNLLVVEGYTFRNERVLTGRTFWKCTEYRKHKCLARCHTENDQIIKNLGTHNHVPCVAKIEARKTMEKVKTRAATTHESTHQIVATVAAETNEAVAG